MVADDEHPKLVSMAVACCLKSPPGVMLIVH